MRGARYGLPCWVGQQERKSAEPKPVYLDRGDAEAKAREFLVSAKTAGDIAGRQIVLLAMARYADEQAVAQSGRSFYTLTPGRQLPWSGEVIDARPRQPMGTSQSRDRGRLAGRSSRPR